MCSSDHIPPQFCVVTVQQGSVFEGWQLKEGHHTVLWGEMKTVMICSSRRLAKWVSCWLWPVYQGCISFSLVFLHTFWIMEHLSFLLAVNHRVCLFIPKPYLLASVILITSLIVASFLLLEMLGSRATFFLYFDNCIADFAVFGMLQGYNKSSLGNF